MMASPTHFAQGGRHDSTPTGTFLAAQHLPWLARNHHVLLATDVQAILQWSEPNHGLWAGDWRLGTNPPMWLHRFSVPLGRRLIFAHRTGCAAYLGKLGRVAEALYKRGDLRWSDRRE